MPKCLRRVCASLGIMLLFYGALGCGGGPTTVSGKVSYKGAPVTGGSIKFTFDGGKEDSGGIDQRGNYSLQVTSHGKARVSIETESIKGAGVDALAPPGGEKLNVPAMPGGEYTYVQIPARYADPGSSNLTVDVKTGTQTKNWELTD